MVINNFSKKDISKILHTKNMHVDGMSKIAIEDNIIRDNILDGLSSKNKVFRYNCFKILDNISRSNPGILYKDWEKFADMLKSDNSYNRSSAITLLANLTQVDSEDKVNTIFEFYFGLLDDKSLVTARYLAQNAEKIALNKPELRSKIIRILLDIDKTRHTEDRKDLIKVDIIRSFGPLYKDSKYKDEILSFVKDQLESSSQKTRKAAEDFLKKYG